MPYAREQRDKKIASDNPAGTPDDQRRMRYAHYTSAEAALKIISTKRLWMRSTTCMSDFKEVEHGYAMLLRFFSEGNNKSRFLDAANSCIPGIGEIAIGLFDKWWSHIRFNTHITSVSDHPARENDRGRLSMWRAFGDNQPRVALVFSVPLFTNAAAALGISFSPVAYLPEREAHNVVNQVIENLNTHREYLKSTLSNDELTGWIFQLLLLGVACLKHEGFQEEQEWRGVYTTGLAQPSLLESAIEVVRGVPQRIYKIPFDKAVHPALEALDMANILECVVIGPTLYPRVMYDAFTEALAIAGVPKAGERVCMSDIPIRI